MSTVNNGDWSRATSEPARDAAPMRHFLMVIEINGERQTVGVETNDEQHARETLAKMQPNARIISMVAQDENETLAKGLKQAQEDDDFMDFTPGETDHRSIDPNVDALSVSAMPVKAAPVQAKPVRSIPVVSASDDVDPRDPDPSREGIFRTHNCSYCDNGKKPCLQGSPARCEYPRARND